MHDPATTPPGAFARILRRAALVIVGPFYFLAIAFAPLLCRNKAGFRGWYWRTVKRACSQLLWLLSIRVEMSEADKARLATDTNSLIVINHRSHLDGFTLMDVVPDQKWFTFAAKKEFFSSRLLKVGFTAAGLVPIDRSNGKAALETLVAAVKAMPERRSVVLFPEGTRSEAEVLGPFRAGAVLAARETGRSILPIVICDSDALLPRGRFSPKPGTIHLKALPAIHCDPEASVDEDVARLHNAMREALLAHKASA
ncbi:lysophospholipid acyltransferase family protein [Pseudoruegeria sp. SHC-113]|uniref:lysophospholipid acyltransferase family protein n=1 Tax=Pseudoruegeria sp. SHC-113 TaxID=2855439 RepID=UPI0021BAFA7E|nr:lysophospholipid acyltransferase family protein [Pseudoruegeria sp. SHC-113]MCT8160396.1 1-acyl-sn-glycerol-3-phosphate acyltransferase [Pseudoruegeria sp. SHC-113]